MDISNYLRTIKIKQCFVLAILLTNAISVYATDERRQVCSSQSRTITFYYGYVECEIGPYWNSINVSRSDAQTSRSIDIPVTNGFGDLVGVCIRNLPLSFEESEATQTCTDVPYEPYVDSVTYEYANCRGSLRRGFITWDSVDVSRYELQQQLSRGWSTIVNSDVNYVGFDQAGGTTHSLRIRAFEAGYPDSNNGYSTWRYFTARVPSCGSGGDGRQPL